MPTAERAVAVAHSLVNKHVHVQLGPFESKSRYWVVGTAEPGVGTRPTIGPAMHMLLDVGRENAALFPGNVSDNVHYRQSSTSAAAMGAWDAIRDAEAAAVCWATLDIAPSSAGHRLVPR